MCTQLQRHTRPIINSTLTEKKEKEKSWVPFNMIELAYNIVSVIIFFSLNKYQNGNTGSSWPNEIFLFLRAANQ